MKKSQSVFVDAAHAPVFPSLEGEVQADVAVIGGGITGITAAVLLAIAGKSVVVIEERSIAKGSTGSSTGNLYATVGAKGMHSIKSKFDDKVLHDVVSARANAVDLIEEMIARFSIDCDFKRVSWNLFTSHENQQPHIDKERQAAFDAGLPVSNAVPFPIDTQFGFSVPAQAQFNPYKYVAGLAEKIVGTNCKIFEDSKVIRIENQDTASLVYTNHGSVAAQHVIMATHTPKGIYKVHTLMGAYREYAVAVKLNCEYPPEGTFWDLQEKEHYSIRTCESAQGKVLMVLGQMHKVGQKEDNTACFERLEQWLRERFDVATVVYRWAAQQYRPADMLPYIGRTQPDVPVYIATGFAADGLTYGTMAAMIITDDILGIKNPYAETFDARRSTPLVSAPEFLKENLNVAMQFIKDLPSAQANHFSDVAAGEGKTIEVDGNKYAAYRQDDGTLQVVSAICPHLKCVVHFNKAERSWDCPCHGSRFDTCGKVLEGPAIADLAPMQGGVGG
jgi:glycine/D-amino acid oxidase-like deaminating enzyme/nitrite reductase/ring-hydroxylating ferredoxin subunit